MACVQLGLRLIYALTIFGQDSLRSESEDLSRLRADPEILLVRTCGVLVKCFVMVIQGPGTNLLVLNNLTMISVHFYRVSVRLSAEHPLGHCKCIPQWLARSRSHSRK